MPTAAINGRRHCAATFGINAIVVVSSRPLCPPASKPSATTASHPASSHFKANAALLTTCATFIPCPFRKDVHFFGLPADVNTTFTPSSTSMPINASISGYNKGTFTPHGLSVASFMRRMCSRNVSGCIEPAPSKPSPPQLLTADASRQPLHHTMPPDTTG